MDLNSLWEKALGEIELQVSRPNFATWLKNSKLISNKESGAMTVGLPNNFAKEWVENKYHKIILGALRNIDSNIRKVEYCVHGNQLASTAGKSANLSEKNHQLVFSELKVDPETNLNPSYTLDSFVVGSSNEMAHAAVSAVLKNIGKKYNPLFIYGGVGVGKTHLIQGLGNEINKLYENKIKIRYVPSEKFTNEVIWAMRNKRMETIKDKYRMVDVLIIDDIQFVGGKARTEEEFFHTFNALYEANKQIVLSSDRSPRFIPILEERLRSRFEGGMIVDITYPDYELKVAVLKNKLASKGAVLNDEVVNCIANKVRKGLRELEGILNRILFYQQVKNLEITTKLAEQIMSEVIKEPVKNIGPDQIIKTVADYFEISPSDLISRSRKKELVECRQITAYLLRDILSLSYPFIGERLGKRDHTTVIYACEKITRELSNNQTLSQNILTIKDRLIKN
ncbi:MAG: chromosomal replication initiator protein DnaA [Nanoarchaeota archaeon]